MEPTIRIVLADDHAVVRSGLRLLLDAEPGLEVVAEAKDAGEAKRIAMGHKPDVLVVDLSLPGRPSLEVIPEISRVAPGTKVVVLTVEDDLRHVRGALAAGVDGYVLKEATGAELVRAIRRAAQGQTYVQPALASRLDSEPQPEGGPLTDRELEVLRLVALGHTNPEIAHRLFLSVRTVEDHRSRLNRKLGISTRAELVRFALGHGLVQL